MKTGIEQGLWCYTGIGGVSINSWFKNIIIDIKIGTDVNVCTYFLSLFTEMTLT